MRHYLALLVSLLALSCTTTVDDKLSEKELIEEVRNAEKLFNDMAAEKGVKEAFLEFVASDGIINRGGKIYKGVEEIESYFNSQTLTEVNLKWNPDFIDVSESGDMAYTYGPYTFSAVDTSGQLIESKGIFHTVWKKQPNGKWKFVYD